MEHDQYHLSPTFELYQFFEGPDFSLPPGWAQDIERIGRRFARAIFFDGKSVTSRRPAGPAIMNARVDGEVIREQIGWLSEAYRGIFKTLAESASHRKLVTSPSDREAININLLGSGDCTGKHVDTNHWSGLLFATGKGRDGGGELVLDGESFQIQIPPIQGMLIFFDGRRFAHSVNCFTGDGVRISVPMNYYYHDEPIERPGDLNRYLYGDE